MERKQKKEIQAVIAAITVKQDRLTSVFHGTHAQGGFDFGCDLSDCSLITQYTRGHAGHPAHIFDNFGGNIRHRPSQIPNGVRYYSPPVERHALTDSLFDCGKTQFLVKILIPRSGAIR